MNLHRSISFVPSRLLAMTATFLLAGAFAHAGEPFLEKLDLFTSGDDPAYQIYHIPGIVVTAKGTVLAWCEARKRAAGVTDWDDIRILLRRSTDEGRTWSAPKSIADLPGPKTKNPFSLRMKGVDPDDVTYNNLMLIADRDGTVHMLFCLEYERCFYQRSADDGVTWSTPVEITAAFEDFRKDYDWKVLATGPNHSIQLKTGRLSCRCGFPPARRKCASSCARGDDLSDDAGQTWRAGEIAVPCTEEWINPSETVAVELANGSVMLNVRSESKAHRRLVTISKDGATDRSTPRFDDAPLEPVCMGGIVRYRHGGKNLILFSNPHNLGRADGKEAPGENRDRKNVSVKLSYDEGQSWAVNKSIEPGPSMYSDMTVTKSGTILCFYGRGGNNTGLSFFVGGHHTLARFNLEWLTDGKDSTAP